MYLLGLIVPIYALVDFEITRSQRVREAVAAAAMTVATNGTVTATSTNVSAATAAAAATNATSSDSKNRLADEQVIERERERERDGSWVSTNDRCPVDPSFFFDPHQLINFKIGEFFFSLPIRHSTRAHF